MPANTILCVADDPSANNPVANELERAGYHLTTARTAAQAAAVLFVNRKVDGVVLDQHTRERANFEVAALLRKIRADVPIFLVSSGRVERLPRCVDACVCLSENLDGLLPTMEVLLGRTTMA
jgi:DNA-binding response OmpR family regulator